MTAPPPGQVRLTRRAVLAGSGSAAVAAVVGVPLLTDGRESAPTVMAFRSRPDLKPPAVDVMRKAGPAAPGYMFSAPKKGDGQAGAMILDSSGELVWFRPAEGTKAIYDFRVQRYRGRPVLTWWEGNSDKGVGFNGHGTILDSSYREIATVRAGHGYSSDLHEFELTARDTALVSIYHAVPQDLSSAGGPADGKVFDCIVQEIDVQSGRVLFEWRCLEHVPLEESQHELPEKASEPWDYFHINAVSEDLDGNLLISSRHTSTIYKVDRSSGDVIWRLGGKAGDFKFGRGATFVSQHDARRHPDGTLSLFDNGAPPSTGRASRGLVLRLDEDARTADLDRAFTHSPPVHAESQGSLQLLPGGHALMGWGSGGQPDLSEFGANGNVLFDLRFSNDDTESYRATRSPWSGRPSERPALAAETSGEGVRAYASWNGSTHVARWEALAGRERGRLEPQAAVARSGFETRIDISIPTRFVAVQALDAQGTVIGRSRVVELAR